MKDITTLINQEPTQDHTREEKLRVRDFVVSVFSLFADYRNEYTKEDYFKQQCRLWAKEIIAMSEESYFKRLDMIKKIIAVSNLHNLHGNYKTPNSALAIACMPIEHLNHDYGIAFPRTGSTGALQALNDREGSDLSQEEQERRAQALKDMFKD